MFSALPIGLYIISSCGFDSIPADIGTTFLKDQNEDVEIKTVEGYIKARNPDGFSINTGTFYSLLESLANYRQLKDIRNRMFAKFYKKQVTIEKPKLRLLQRAPYSKSGFYVPFWMIDAAVVKRTQLMFYNENESDKPLSLTEYLHVPTIFHALFMVLALLSIGIFNLCSFTRNLLKKWPQYFTFGIFSSVSILGACDSNH